MLSKPPVSRMTAPSREPIPPSGPAKVRSLLIGESRINFLVITPIPTFDITSSTLPLPMISSPLEKKAFDCSAAPAVWVSPNKIKQARQEKNIENTEYRVMGKGSVINFFRLHPILKVYHTFG